MPARTRPTTTARGLGHAHRKRRAGLLRVTPDGALCWWCGHPMYPQTDPDSVDADHSRARARGGRQADRLLHSQCNRARGDGSRDHLRPALVGVVQPNRERSAPLAHSREW